MAAFLHGPLWFWYLLIGLAVAAALIMVYNRWPTFIRAIAFLVSVVAWPLVLVFWTGYALIFPRQR